MSARQEMKSPTQRKRRSVESHNGQQHKIPKDLRLGVSKVSRVGVEVNVLGLL